MTIQDPIYNPNVPQFPNQALADSQPNILNDFKVLFDRFLVDHVTLDDPSFAGNHKTVHLIEQITPQQTGTSETAIYAKKADGQSDQIFIRYQGNGQEFEYTTYQIYSIKSETKQTYNFTFLPGRLLVYFGSIFPNAAPFEMNLWPNAAKKILSLAFCPITVADNSKASAKPLVKIEQDPSGLFTKLLVYNPGIVTNIPPNYYYIVVARI